MNWYYANAGDQKGPLTQDQFDQLVATGAIHDGTLVWREGMAAWQPWGTLTPAATPAAPPTGLPTAGAAGPAVEAVPGQVRCGECGGSFAEESIVRFGPQVVCAGCKPLFLQRLREGAKRPQAMELGSNWRRFVADVVDNLILLVPFFLVMGLAGGLIGFANAGAGGPTGGAMTGFMALQVLAQLVYLVAYVLYNALLTGRYGYTLGKKVMGLKVVRADGSAVGYGLAFGRTFAEVLSGMICYLGYIIAFFDAEKRTLHDHICNTRVVKR
jgi:uncharacterized RDD family membrane protein YckC